MSRHEHPANPSGDQRTTVLVADDSPVARQLLTHILTSDPRLRVVGEASDGIQTIQLAEQVRPAVIVMDVLMPDGLRATRQIMQTRPTPIVLVSAGYDPCDLNRSFQALQAGAVTILGKPRGPHDPQHAAQATMLTTSVTLMAEVQQVRRRTPRPIRNAATSGTCAQLPPIAARSVRHQPITIAAVAASTGGPAALATILGALPAATPVPILVVQHITAGFSHGLASWLDSMTPLTVRLARQGEPLRPGHVFLAPAQTHLGVTAGGSVALSRDPPIGVHRPSATHLFRSLARAYPGHAAAVILTGMGDDGAAGLQALKEAGGLVLAQDERTSIVYGMPKQAVATGTVDQVLPLDQIAGALAAAWEAATP